MRRLLLRQIPVVLFVSFSFLSLVGQAAPPQLVNATFHSISDTRGFAWQPYPSYGNFHGSSSSSAFRDAGILRVNQQQFSPMTRQMTSDRSEYHFTNTNLGGFHVQRRLAVNSKAGTGRIIDKITNNTPRPVTAEIMVSTQLRYPGSATVSDKGRATAGALTAGETGLAIRSSRQGSPSTLIVVSGRSAKVQPTIQIQNNYSVNVTWRTSLQPGESATIIHGYAQRNLTAMDAKTLKTEFAVFKPREFLQGISSADAKSVINMSVGGAGFESQPLLYELTELTDYWDVERGASDALVLDEGSVVQGELLGGPLQVSTALGDVDLPLSEVAAIAGGVDQTRVFLRNGEILVGRVSSGDDFRLRTEKGLVMKLLPEKTKLVTTRKLPGDGKASELLHALVQTTGGNRVGVPSDKPLTLNMASAWGPIRIPTEKIHQLIAVLEPQPVFQLTALDRSQVNVMLTGAVWNISTTRFGDLELPPAEILQISNPHAAGPASDGSDKVGPNPPHIVLDGENRLTGRFGTDTLAFRTGSGETLVAANDITEMSRTDDGFEVQLRTGASFSGRPAGSTVPFLAFGKTWMIRVDQIERWELPEADDASAPAQPSPAVPSPAAPPRLRNPGDPFGGSGGSADPFGP